MLDEEILSVRAANATMVYNPRLKDIVDTDEGQFGFPRRIFVHIYQKSWLCINAGINPTEDDRTMIHRRCDEAFLVNCFTALLVDDFLKKHEVKIEMMYRKDRKHFLLWKSFQAFLEMSSAFRALSEKMSGFESITPRVIDAYCRG